MTFQAGVSGNPNGRANMSADFVSRLHHWISTHDIEEISKIYNDKRVFNKLPVVDGLCCVRIYEALQDRGGNTMEQLFDRLLGKPSQHTTIDARVLAQVTVSQADRASQADKEAEVMLAAISSRIQGKEVPEPITIEHSPIVASVDAPKQPKVRMTREQHKVRMKAQHKAWEKAKKPESVTDSL